ncbi:MAG: ribosomal protein S18-alanine N-acetyltransferase [Candidatus Cloacimonetes bacterium]|nr:ribosomal protein S18-alanine N-acetyltransferase [Candidatus Cloacimonadota bacterium]
MLLIRRMQMDDLPQVMRLEDQLFSSPWSSTMMIQELNSHEAFVAEFHGQIAGYICCWKVLDECTITNVGVDVEVQRQGIGRRLVNFIMDRMQQEGCDEFFLEVRASNLPALALYRSIGFEVVGVRRKYYSHPVEDAMIMKWEKDEK